jgi:hypothetical protein
MDSTYSYDNVDPPPIFGPVNGVRLLAIANQACVWKYWDMIPKVAWENIRWLKDVMFDRWEQFGGMMIDVDPFRSFFRRSWIKRLKPQTAAGRFQVAGMTLFP